MFKNIVNDPFENFVWNLIEDATQVVIWHDKKKELLKEFYDYHGEVKAGVSHPIVPYDPDSVVYERWKANVYPATLMKIKTAREILAYAELHGIPVVRYKDIQNITNHLRSDILG